MIVDESQKRPSYQSPHNYVYDRKFDIALRESTILAFKRRFEIGELKPRDELIVSRISDSDPDSTISSPHCYALLLSKIMSGDVNPPSARDHSLQWLQRAIHLAGLTTEIQAGYMLNSSEIPSTKRSLANLASKLHSLDIDPILYTISVQTVVWTRIVEQLGKIADPDSDTLNPEELQREKIRRSESFVFGTDWKVSWNGSLCLITTDLGDQFLLPQAYILMIANKLCDLLSVMLLCKMQSGVSLEENAYHLLVSFVKTMANYACKYKNKFFQLTASLEGIIIGMTLRYSDDWSNDTLFQTLVQELRTSLQLDLVNSQLMNILRQCSIPLLHEFSCLSKIWGHPLVSMEGGARKLHRRTTEKLSIDPEAVAFCANKAVESYVLNHICRHGSWPLCEINQLPFGPDPLMQACLRNKSPYHPSIANKFGRIQTSDWARVTCKPNMKFSQIENVIPLLKDKTISVMKTSVMKSFIKTRVMRSPRWEDTRLLLFYLLNTVVTLDHLKYLHKFVEADDLEELSEYLVMKIVPKEKEHKVEFRGFGIKTYWDRFRGLIAEKNVAHFLELYCDQQAMTLSELDIARRLYAFRTIERAFSGHTKLIISFDASGWNNRFRYETTAPVTSRTLDRIFDTPIFSKMHLAYEKTFYYIPDELKTYYWDGQLGGIEGLNQYSWDHVYLPQIDYAMINIDVKYFLFVKGDDLRMVALIKPSMLDQHPLHYWKDRIVTGVANAAKVFGHEIKIQESYGSATFLAFSKMCSIGTIELPQSFRKIQKVYGSNNAFIPSLDEYIGSTLSNAHAAAKVSSTPLGCYVVGAIWFFEYLIIHKTYNSLTDHELVCFSLIPSMLGGFPLIYLHNMFVRAESDLLSPFLDITKYCKEYYPEIYKHLRNFLMLDIPKEQDWVRLYTDPYALNIKSPRLPSAVLRAHILPQLKRIVKNEDILALIRATESPFSRSVVKCLSQSPVQQVKAFATIYSALPIGVLTELLRKFESGRSVLELLLLRRPKKYSYLVFNRVQRAEDRLQQWRVDKIRGKIHGRWILEDKEILCPTAAAQELRNITWDRIIEGITMPPLPHQISLSTGMQSRWSSHAKHNHFTLYFRPPTETVVPDGPLHWSSAGLTPFLGYTTRTGNVTPMMKLTESDSFVVKLRNLLDLISWVNISKVDSSGRVIQSNLPELIEIVINAFSPIPTSELAPFRALKKSGTQMHHMRSPGFRESIVPNMLSNRYQIVEGKSDTHLMLKTSRHHYTVNFLHILCYGTTLVTFELESSPALNPPLETWVVTTDCPYCTKPISETPIVLDLSCLPNYTPDLSKFQACRIDQISKQIILDSYDVYKQKEWRHVEQANIPLSIASVGIIQEFMAHTRRTHERLEDRYTQHRMTRQGHRVLVDIGMKTASRVVGSTELKLLPIDDIISSLTFEVYRFSTSVLRQVSYDHLVTHFGSVPPSEFPWFQLCCKLSDINRLGKLISTIHKYTAITPPVCYSNPETSSRYIGLALSFPTWLLKCPLKLCKLTYQEDLEMTNLLHTALNLAKFQYLHKEGIDVFHRWQKLVSPPPIGYKLIQRMLDIVQCEFQIEDIIARIKKHDPSDGWLKINPFEFAEGVTNCEYIEENMPFEFLLLSLLRKEFPRQDWNMYISEREDLDDTDIGPELVKALQLHPCPPVQVAIADIAQCITSLRDHHHDEDTITSSEDDATGYHEWPVISLIFDRALLVRFTSGQIGHDDVPPPVVEYDFSSQKLVFDPAFIRRPFGPGTTSVNKLLEILSRTTLRMNIQYTGAQIACLADGYGGFTNLFAELTYMSSILFNTLPPDGGVTAFPELARDTLLLNKHQLNTTALDSGYYDLKETYVMEELESSSMPLDIITCDAEVVWSDLSLVQSIWTHVIIYAHRQLKSHGVLILKVHYGASTQVVRVLELAISLFDNVGLMRPYSSYLGGEVYLVASRRQEKASCYSMEIPDASRRVIALYNKLIRKRIREHEQIVSTKNRSIPLHVSLVAKVPVSLRIRLGPNFVSKCVPVLGGSLPRLSEHIFAGKRASDVLETYRPYLQDLLLSAQRASKDDFLIRSQLSCDLNTHTFHMRCWVQSVGVEGTLWALGEYWSGKSFLSELEARKRFNHLWNRAPSRLQLPPLSPAAFRVNYQLLENSYLHPYRSFVNGVKLACGMIAYVRSRTR